MTSFQSMAELRQVGRMLSLAGAVFALAACATGGENDSTVGSRMAQPPAGAPRQAAIEGGDIALVGEQVSRAIMDLPAVAGASVPPLVRFSGVTSIVIPPVDTEPYTHLLRDRMLLLTREKLRFLEHTLPPLVSRKHRDSDSTIGNTTDPDYEILAELRGNGTEDSLRIQVEFIDAHSRDILYNALFNIRREADFEPADSPQSIAPQAPEQPPPPQQQPDPNAPTPVQMAPPTTSSGVL